MHKSPQISAGFCVFLLFPPGHIFFKVPAVWLLHPVFLRGIITVTAKALFDRDILSNSAFFVLPPIGVQKIWKRIPAISTLITPNTPPTSPRMPARSTTVCPGTSSFARSA